MKEIVFVTGNERKLARTKDILRKYDIEVKQVDIETPEIQANDVTEVAGYLLEKPQGEIKNRWSIDPLFVPIGRNETINQMSDEERNKIFANTSALEKIAERIREV